MWSLEWVSPAWVTTVINEKENSYQIYFQIRLYMSFWIKCLINPFAREDRFMPSNTDGVQCVLSLQLLWHQEAQTHRMAEAGRELWRLSGPTLPTQAGPLGASCPGPCPFRYLQRWRLHGLCSTQWPSQYNSCSLCSDSTSCVSICAHCLWSCL